jgi:hypothetical protein
MPKKPVRSNSLNIYKDDEIESTIPISQDQLNNAKLYSSREEYAKTLNKGIKYLELGVAWGYSAKMFIDASEASEALLVDLYNQDLKCWSWRKFGSCQCDGLKHELLYTPETHQIYIIDKFSYHPKVATMKGNAANILSILNNKYDFIYIDIVNERNETKKVLSLSSNLVPIGGIIGLNDYVIYDGIIEDKPYGTYQTVNEFLHINKNWHVDGLALHQMGFYDIYIKRIY